MARKKKKKKAEIDMHLPKQVVRQLQAKYESVETMQEKAQQRDEMLRKRGFLKSNASVSSAYGELDNLKANYSSKARRFVNITSIPMK